MHPRFSVIDPRRSVTIDGTTVPGLRVREFAVAAVAKSGKTLVIGGTVQHDVEEKAAKPTAGKPTKKVRSETTSELVVVARIEMVDAPPAPVSAATARQPALPAPMPTSK